MWRDKLCRFMQAKNLLIFEECGLILMDDRDFQELMEKFGEESAEEFFSNIKLYGIEELVDSAICPNCFVYKSCKSYCLYGWKNGICSNINSRYSNILRRIRPKYYNLVDLIGKYLDQMINDI